MAGRGGPGIASLDQVPGVGEKVREKLVEHFGSEQEAVKAIVEARVDELAEALGSYRKAVRLIQAARASMEGFSPAEMFGTPDARRLFEKLVETLASSAHSRPARVELETLTPAPRRVWTWDFCRPSCPAEPSEKLAAALASVSWPRLPRRLHAEALIVAPPGGGEAARRAAAERGIVAEVVEAEVYECSGQPALVLPGVEVAGEGPCIVAREPSPWLAAPKAVLDAVLANRAVYEALILLAEEAPCVAERASKAVGAERLADIVNAARRLLEIAAVHAGGRYSSEHADAVERLRKLDSLVSDLEVWVNEEVKRRLSERELRLSAAQLLSLLESIEEGSLRLPPEIEEVFEEVALEAEERLARELGLDVEHARLVSGLVEPQPRLPLSLRQDRVEALRRALAARAEALRFQTASRLAEEAWRLLPLTRIMFRVVVWADKYFACIKYRELVAAGETRQVEGGALGVAVRGGREVELARRLGPDSVEPVDYVIGCTPFRPEGTSCEPVAILTGANSGGKTTLLRLVAETVLAAHAGIPAPAAEAWVSGFDRVYYISKPTGMLSAGALETLLRKLAEIVREARRKRILVLVDEFEAVTEAQAAARIVAALAETLIGSGNAVAVIVSHMADEILSALPPELRSKVRVDGIEALGLDENYNLIVRRSPRFSYHARSTPELVVRRLLHRAPRGEKSFYEKLLTAFQAREAPPPDKLPHTSPQAPLQPAGRRAARS
ncbi:MAG: AAA family ATPase [Crenarchaeota archaeon]|nr:AAA family ATPase [Thermoproteota archaeon]